jgi:uncharacterized protein (DUF1697 family)
MSRYVAFLRAVNVGGRRVAMGRLRDELTALGYDDVSTYINSGNAIFRAGGHRDALVAEIEARLGAAFGFEIPTVLRTDDEVSALAERRPFGPPADGHTHLVVLLRRRPTAAQARAVEALTGDVDRLVVDGTEVHWHIAGKQMDSALKDRDWKALGDQPTTTRNHTMLVKLAAKLDA